MIAVEPLGSIVVVFDRFPCRVEEEPKGTLGYYTYQPHRYDAPDAPVTGCSGLQPYTKNEDGTWTKPPAVWYPYFATPDEAVAYMVKNRIHGQVQRYYITSDLGPLKKDSCFGGGTFKSDNNPYMTAGCVRCVETKTRENTGMAHCSPLGGIAKKDVAYV